MLPHKEICVFFLALGWEMKNQHFVVTDLGPAVVVVMFQLSANYWTVVVAAGTCGIVGLPLVQK